MRIAFLTTHPIQYQAPLFRTLHARSGVNLTVFFCHDHGVRPTYDSEFKRTIQFDVPLLEGYEHRFLRNVATHPGLTPMGMINPGIVPIVASGAFDALIIHGYSYVTNAVGLCLPHGRTRVLYRSDSNLLSPISMTKRVGKQLAMRALFSRIDHFLAAGAANRDYYRAYGVSDDRITVAPFSVDNEFFLSRSLAARRDPAAARHRLGLPERGPLFVSVAKLMAKKRPFDLLEAFARAEISNRAGLVYIGDGDLRADLTARIEALGLSQPVRVLGFRNQTELPEILGAADVLVLPSDFEPWGLAVNEAMACGMAAVVSDRVGAKADLIDDPRCTFRSGDVEQLGPILRTLVDYPELLRELKTSASSRIRRWGLDETADGVIRGVETALRS